MNPSSTIRISFNGKPLLIPADGSLMDVLERAGTPQPPFALALNNQFVQRSMYAGTRLQRDDCVDLVVPVQGG